MGFRDWMIKILGGAPAPGTFYPSGSTTGMVPVAGPLTFPGWPDRTGREAQTPIAQASTAMTSAWAFSDVQYIAREASTAALAVQQITAGSEKAKQVTNHAFELLWRRPNPFFGRSALMQLAITQLLLSGELYLFFAPAGNDLAEIWVIPSWAMRPEAHPTEFISGYLWQPRADRDPIRIRPEFISYTRLPNPFDPRRGLSPLRAAMMGVQTDLGQAAWNRNFFTEENAQAASIVSLPAETTNPDFERFRTELREYYGSGQRRTMVVRGGQIDWKTVQGLQKDMEFMAGRGFSRDEIDRVFGFPSGFWVANATEANQRGAKAVVVETAVWPLLVLIAEDVTAQILGRWYGPDFEAAFEDIRPRNVELDLRERQANESTWTVNELRAIQGKKPLEGEIWNTAPAQMVLSGTAAAAQDNPALALPEPVGRDNALEDTDGASAGPTKAAQPILGYHIEQGVATRNEARATVGLGPLGGEEQDVRLKTLQATLGVVKLARDVGIPLNEALKLTGMNITVAEEATPDQQMEADEVEDERVEVMAKWERKALKALRAGRGAAVKFATDALNQDEQERISESLATATTPEQVRDAFKAQILTDAERALADKIIAIFDRFGPQALRDIERGEVVSFGQLDSGLRSALLPAILEYALAQMTNLAEEIGPDFDPAQMMTTASQWAQTYTFDLVSNLTTQTRTVVQNAIAAYTSTPGMTREALERLLRPAFGLVRAESIAVSEVTRSASQAARIYQQYLAENGLTFTRHNNTNADDRVCSICGPLNGKPEADWPNSDGPPWHPRCRCAVTLKKVKA